MITYHIDGKDNQNMFLSSVSKASKKTDLCTECDCPLCKSGKITIVRSERINGYMHALCNSCGAGAFN